MDKKKPSLQRAQTQFDSPQNLIELYLKRRPYGRFLVFSLLVLTPNSVNTMNTNGITSAIMIKIDGVTEVILSVYFV
jgi:hypothetical protein